MKRLLLVVVATLLALNWLSAEVGTPKDGMALTFDGSNDYLRVEAAPEIEVLNNMTVETWVYLTRYSTFQTFITGESDLTYYSWTLREGDGGDGKLEFVLASSNSSYEYVRTASGSIPLNKWTHVAGVYNNTSSTMTVYINGENAGSNTFTGPIYPSNEGMFLGRYPNDNSAYLNGSLDNTAVWNTVRTQAEIKETMYTNLNGDETGLLAYYDYDFEDGTIVEDKAGSFDAMLNNMDDEDWVESDIPVLGTPKEGMGLAFDGSNDYVTTTAVVSSSYSKIAWVKNTVYSNSNIISGVESAFWAPSGILSAGHNNQWQLVKDNEVLDLDKWYFVAVTYDASTTTMKLYKNGLLVNENNAVSAMSGDDIQNLGVYGGSSLWNGIMDDVSIWDVALTQDQVNEYMTTTPLDNEAGLVAYYDMDFENGNVLLDKANNNNGILTNMDDAAWVESDIPVLGTPKDSMALSFDGTEDYVNIGDIDLISNGVDGEYSLSTWIQVPSHQQSFVIGDETTANGGIMLQLDGGHVETFAAGSYGTSTYQLPINQWVYMTLQQTNEGIDLYIDGVFSQQLTTEKQNDVDELMHLGAFSCSGFYRFFNGELDEVSLWNKALTTEQIQTNMCVGLSGNEDGLVAYYDMDFESGDILLDKANNNNGILTNMDNAAWVEVSRLLTPAFDNIPSDLNVDENSAANTVLVQVSASDPDNDGLTYSFVNTQSVIAINSLTGEVSILDSAYFDAEKNSEITFGIKVTNNTTLSFNIKMISIVINDLADEPVITSIAEQEIPFTVTGTVMPDLTSLVKDNATDDNTLSSDLVIVQSIAVGDAINDATSVQVVAIDEDGNPSDTLSINLKIIVPGLVGDGSESNPYQIANLTHLCWLSESDSVWVGKYFIQTNDINAKDTENWNNGKGFACIGSTVEDPNGDCFEGSYDGQGQIIDSLYINRPTETVIGLFASCNNCSVRKLGLTNATVTGSNYVGILKGVDYNNLQSTVDQCFTTGVVTGGYSVGGLIGHSGYTSLTNSYSTAQVNAGSSAYAGGLCGSNYVHSNINNCYSTGLINSTSGQALGLSGLNDYYSAINNSFWDIESSMKTTSAGGTGKTTAYMHVPSTFADAGWDFINETNNGSEDIWGINPNDNGGYPFLSWQGFTSITDYEKPVVSAINDQVLKYSGADIIASLPSYIDTVRNRASDNMTAKEDLIITQSIAAGTMISSSTEITVTVQDETGNISELTFAINLQPSDLIGEGTEASPYEIANLCHLKWLSETSTVWDKHISQTADINAKDTETWNEGKGFSSIGTRATLFSGVYNGNGHIIDSLYINRPEQNNTSFFGVTKASSTTIITKLGLTNVNITGYDAIGGFLGTGETSSTNRAVISECFVTGKVSGHYAIGGFTGGALAMQISNCYSIVEVNATGTYCGGFAGTSYYGLIDNCYSTGKISATTHVGGFTAYDDNATHSFWDTEISGIAISTCGTGKTTIDMHSPSTFADAGWDFINETNNGSDDIWGINPDVNGGYPFLTWQGLTSVADYVKPVISAIANQEVLQEANGTNGVLPNYVSLVNATDNVTTPANFEVSQLPAAGTVISGDNNTVTITVKDEAANYDTTTFTVKVVNKAPVFNDISSTLSIPENSSVGTTLLTVSATDENSDDLCFSTTASMVAVDESTGVVTILDASYFEKGKGASVSFEVKVSDGTLEDIETVTISISVVTSVSCQWSNQDVVLYPNPAKDNVTLKLPKFENEVVIELVNVNGAVVLKQNVLNEKTSFNTSNLCSGMYIMLITTDNTTIQKQLLIK